MSTKQDEVMAELQRKRTDQKTWEALAGATLDELDARGVRLARSRETVAAIGWSLAKGFGIGCDDAKAIWAAARADKEAADAAAAAVSAVRTTST